MALIKGMTKKEYMRQYYLKHSPKPTKYKIPCEHGLIISKCKICQARKRKEYYQLHPKLHHRPPKYSACIICGNTFRRFGSATICGKAECKKARRNLRDRAFREEVRSHYGTCCAVCGSDSNLEIDHKYGHGRQHRLEVVNSPTASNTFYQWLKRNNYPTDYTVNGVTYKDGFRVLCKSCNNRQKRYHYNVGHEVSEEQRKKISQSLKKHLPQQ